MSATASRLLCIFAIPFLVACSESPTAQLPEDPADSGPWENVTSLGTRLTLNDTIYQLIQGESRHLFTLRADAGQIVTVFIQSLAPHPQDVITAYLSYPGDHNIFLAHTIQGPVTETLSRWTVAQNGSYTLVVRGGRLPAAGPSVFPIFYRMWFEEVDLLPESVTPDVAIGQMVEGESLDHAGDIDVFTLFGEPGTEFNVFFQAQGEADSELRLGLPPFDHYGYYISRLMVASRGDDPDIMANPVGKGVIPDEGSMEIVVLGVHDHAVSNAAAYRFLVKEIDFAPSVASAFITPGDSILDERIDYYGDVDDFYFELANVQEAGFFVEVPSNTSEQVYMSLFREEGEQWLDQGGEWVREGQAHRTYLLEPGRYRLRIRTDTGRRNEFTGPYHLLTTVIDRAPEDRSPYFEIGDEVEGRISPLGDVDEFRFTASRGQALEVAFDDWDLQRDIGLWLSVHGPDTTQQVVRHGPRFIAPETGEYRVRIESNSSARPEEGSYRFMISEFDTSPETASPVVAVGDTLSTEDIDYPGDVDEFLLMGDAGSFFAATFSSGGGLLWIDFVDPVTQEPIGRLASDGYTVQTAAPLQLPSSGQLLIRIGFWGGECWCWVEPTVGSYWFTTEEVDQYWPHGHPA